MITRPYLQLREFRQSASATTSTKWLVFAIFSFILLVFLFSRVLFFSICFRLFSIPLHVPFLFVSSIIFITFHSLLCFDFRSMFQKLVSDFFLLFFFPRFFPECLRCFFVGLFSYVYIRGSCTLFLNLLLLLKSQKNTHTQLLRRVSMLATGIYHSTAHRNQPCTKQRSTYVPIRVRQRRQADRVCENQQVVEHLSAACCLLKTNEEIEFCPAKRKIQSQAAGDSRRICLYSFSNLTTIQHYNILLSLSYLFFVSCICARGVRVVFLEHGALGICTSSVCT